MVRICSSGPSELSKLSNTVSSKIRIRFGWSLCEFYLPIIPTLIIHNQDWPFKALSNIFVNKILLSRIREAYKMSQKPT